MCRGSLSRKPFEVSIDDRLDYRGESFDRVGNMDRFLLIYKPIGLYHRRPFQEFGLNRREKQCGNMFYGTERPNLNTQLPGRGI